MWLKVNTYLTSFYAVAAICGCYGQTIHRDNTEGIKQFINGWFTPENWGENGEYFI